MRKRSVFTAIVAQTTQNIWNFVVGKSSLQEIATLTIIREISDSNLEVGKIMLTELYYLHVSLSMKCTRPTRLVVGLICYRHSNWNTWNTTFSESKIFSSFFANGPIKFKHSTMQPLKTLHRLNLPDLSGNRPQINELYCSVCKKTWENFAFRKCCVPSISVWVSVTN